MLKIGNAIRCLHSLYQDASRRGFLYANRYIENTFEKGMFLLGIVLLNQGLSEIAHAGSGSYAMACNGILSLVEGTFGALLTSVAGIGAIVASAMGGFKMAWSLVVVAVGSFILRSYITLFNGDCGAFAHGNAFGTVGVPGNYIGVGPGGVTVGIGF